MSSRYYTPGEQRAQKVQQLFERIARRYDFINDLQSFGLHRFWKRKMATLAQVRSGMNVLDVCCGTGDVGRLLAAQGARVVGCDFSGAMLHAAPEPNKSQLFIQADALHLPFTDRPFDVVTIAYGLRNLASFEAGLAEMLRMLKPGCRLIILDFGRPENTLWRSLYFTYLKLVVPLFGLFFAGDAAAYRYILHSLAAYPAQRGVSHLLAQFGCEPVQVHNLLGGVMSIHVAAAPATLRVPQCSAANV